MGHCPIFKRNQMMENTLMEDRQSGFYYGYVVVGAVFVIMAIIWGTFATFGIFFESFIKTFGWTRALTSGASSVRDLFFGVVCILTARLADPLGPRIVITTSGFHLWMADFLCHHRHFRICFGCIGRTIPQTSPQ
jgi:hypothetical protein